MKHIAKFDELLKMNAKPADHPEVCYRLVFAYGRSINKNADALDFDDIVWDNEVVDIVKGCREEGIERITISSTFSGLTDLLWEFVKNGCRIVGMKQVPAPYTEYDHETKETFFPLIPAVELVIEG